jgi:hypothetical protein
MPTFLGFLRRICKHNPYSPIESTQEQPKEVAGDYPTGSQTDYFSFYSPAESTHADLLPTNAEAISLIIECPFRYYRFLDDNFEYRICTKSPYSLLGEITPHSVPEWTWSEEECKEWLRLLLITFLGYNYAVARILADTFEGLVPELFGMGVRDWYEFLRIGGWSEEVCSEAAIELYGYIVFKRSLAGKAPKPERKRYIWWPRSRIGK